MGRRRGKAHPVEVWHGGARGSPSHGSKKSSGQLGTFGPGDQFVVKDSSVQADIEDSDRAVGQLPDPLSVGLVPGAELVVVIPGSR
jgi:hypothetical protein